MPIIRSAKKKMRQDIRRTALNTRTRQKLHRAVKTMRVEPSAKHLHAAYQILDTAAKKHIIHPNKAARLKSGLSKLLKGVNPAKPEKKIPATRTKPKTKRAASPKA